MSKHAYPQQFAKYVYDHWNSVAADDSDKFVGDETESDSLKEACALPSLDVLESLLSTCYQASLLHEEARISTFRVIVAEPECFLRSRATNGSASLTFQCLPAVYRTRVKAFIAGRKLSSLFNRSTPRP